jgi:uncharacterized membrane-anchored protein
MQIIGAQGELRIYRIDALPEGVGDRRPKRGPNGFILAHSERGHHHVIDGSVDVIEHEDKIRVGNTSLAMRTLYAIVREPTRIRQTATNCHADILLDEGIYAIRADVEYDPFAEQIREVRD